MQLLNMQFLQYVWDCTIKIRRVKNCLINKYKTSLAITIEPKHISCYSVILPHWSDPVAVANIHTSTSHYSVMALDNNLWLRMSKIIKSRLLDTIQDLIEVKCDGDSINYNFKI